MKASGSRVLGWLLLVASGSAAARRWPPSTTAQAPSSKPLASRGDWGEWLRYFRGDTHGTRDMVVLAVTL